MEILQRQRLEAKYLKAKIEYYEGIPIMTDAEFDSLEEMLIKAGSKVHEQIGSKRKDFDFPHPTKMLSLSKIQMEKDGDITNYMYNEFYTWFEKRAKVVGKLAVLKGSPKFDGSAINIIYRDGNLENILTRGDGLTGKNVTKRFKPVLPQKIKIQGIVQIRCEVVIDLNLFNKKYKGTPEEGKYANARNFVAGVIGKDDYSKQKVSELTLVPLHFLVDGKHVSQILFKDYPAYQKDWNEEFIFEDYETMIKKFEEKRKTFNFQLDGVVIAFPEVVRADLGENDHDPEWSLAIKFIPEGAITTVNGIEWNVGKRGQLTPVVLLDPVELAGTTVKRASGYNAGYLIDNIIWIGSVVSIAKAGDIIPEIQKVIVETPETFVLPANCPICETRLTFDKIHLICPNESCPGRISKKLASSSGLLDLKGVGGERLKPFAVDFLNMYELMKWVFTKGDTKEIEKYDIKYGERLHEIFVNAFKNIKSLPYEKVIQLLGYENVGRKISKQLAKEHAGLKPDYASLEKALVEKLHEPKVEQYIKHAVKTLESLGITIDRPEVPKENNNSFGVVLTGSPKVFGYKTKAEFLTKFPNLFECSMSDAECKYLITDNLNSTSGKMKQAAKKGIEIKTYGDF